MDKPEAESATTAGEERQTGVTYRNPLAEEMTQREAAIRDMLGSRLKADMNELEITISDYSSDFKIVFDHFCRYLLGRDNLSVINSDGTRQWKRKSSGLLRNFLVSRMAVRDHTYVLVKRYWEADPELARDEDSEFMDQYRTKVKTILVKPQFAFLQDLRNYGVHKSLYPFTLHTQFAGGYMKNDIKLDRDKLLSTYSSWSAPAKQYIESHDGEVDLLTPMEEWSKACREFYEWFHGAITIHHMEDFQAVERAWEEYQEWRRETGTMPPDWIINGGEPPGAPKPRSHKSRDARKKRKRKQRKRR
ncbi:hypothetical protein ACRS5S_09090 [Nocardia asiatica]|uniref:hypothetical protein n=1 Tax=Nocardia asiatica TaxID=209252 RepID=UPI003EE2CA20